MPTDHPNYGTTETSDDKKDYYADDGYASSDISTEDPRATQGVKAIEAISQAWTGWSLFTAYTGVLLLANILSLEQQTTYLLANQATSEFSQLALISTVTVVSSIFLSTVKPIMAKLSDVAGRLEAFNISIFLYVIGYIQQAASHNVATYASAQLFYAAGSTGNQILIQIFIADTSDLLWRAFMSSLPDLPYLWTVWTGSEIFGSLNAPGGAGWRWGYGIWCIIVPVAYIPLFLALFINKRRAKKMGVYPRSPYRGKSVWQVLVALWYDLDFFGLLLLTATIALILIPLTIGPVTAGWDNPSVIAMFCVGGVCLIAFPFWERNRKLAPKAFFPRDIFRNRTALFGFAIAFFYFMAFAIAISTYFFTYLVVVQNKGLTAASNIQKVFSFASSLTSIIVGLLIYWTAHYKYFITVGACLYVVGYGLMIRYRAEGATTGALIGTQIAVGIGGGMLNVPAQLGVQAAVNHQQVAAATAIFLTIFEIGGAVGAAIAGAVWGSTAYAKLLRYLPAESVGDALTIFGSYETAVTYPMGSPTREAINRAYQETENILIIIAICIAALTIPLSFGMQNFKLNQIDQKVKGRVVGGKASTKGDSEADGTTEAEDAATLPNGLTTAKTKRSFLKPLRR